MLTFRVVDSGILKTDAKMCVNALLWGERELLSSDSQWGLWHRERLRITALSRLRCAFKFHYNYDTKVAFILVIPLYIIQVDLKSFLIDKRKKKKHKFSQGSNLSLFLKIWMPEVCFIHLCSEYGKKTLNFRFCILVFSCAPGNE